MTAPVPRPRVVTAAFWCWVAASVMLMTGGMITASVNLLTFRIAGVLIVVAGGALAFLSGRLRRGNARLRRVGAALAIAVVVVLALLARIVYPLTLLAVFPLVAGAVLITRTTASSEEGAA